MALQRLLHLAPALLAAAQTPPVTATRLVDGGSSLRGRVEVQVAGSWGSVCDDSFGVEDAAVVCRSMGLTGGATLSPAWSTYRVGTEGPVNLDEVGCSGSEASLNQCTYLAGVQVDCQHKEDVGVECGPPLSGRHAAGKSCSSRTAAGIHEGLPKAIPNGFTVHCSVPCCICRHPLPCPTPGRGWHPTARPP